MTPAQRSMVTSLLKGGHLRKYINHCGKPAVKLYMPGAVCASTYFYERVYTGLKSQIFKTDKHGRIVLSPSGIRGLRKNHPVKRMYLERHEQQKKARQEFPYDYRTIALSTVRGSATFIGEPSPELVEAVNRMAKIALNQIKTTI